MGANPFRSSCGDYEPPNPNPKNYTILDHKQINGNIALLVDYKGCTTYEGKKVLVYKNVTWAHVNMMKELDPHFSEEKNSVFKISPFARFEPTDEVMTCAMMLMENL